MTKMCALLTALIVFVGASAGALAGEPNKADLAFVTYLQWEHQEYTAAMLVNSIRRWGGEYADCPIYVVLADPERSGFRLQGKNVEFVPLALSDSVRSYPFAAKAFAAAKVEELTAGKAGTLLWLDPETLILGPPREYDLKKGQGAAVAPVTFINTGQAESEPVDAYWGPIYKRCDLDAKKIFAVETFVDCKKIRAWLNCGMFSVRPQRGLLREWAKILAEFINDPQYQRTAITDRIHRTFLHQAVISALIASRLERREIRLLPWGYNYPLFCHDLDFTTLTGGTYRVPLHKKAKKLNELTSVFIESLFAEHADWINLIPPADEPLKTWLIRELDGSLRVDAQVDAESGALLAKVAFEINSGHPAEALKLSAPLSAKNPRHPGILAMHGLALLDCGEFIKAQVVFDQASTQDADNPDVRLGLGELASGKLRLLEASGHLEKAIASSYFKLRAFQSYGKCLHALDRHSEARNVLQQALKEVDQIPEKEKTWIKNSITIYDALGNTRLYQIPDSFKTTAVGFSTHENNIIMPVELNGLESVKLQLDLGQPGGLAISQTLAQKLGLKVIGEESGGNVAREYKMQAAIIDSLRLGDLVVRNVLVHFLPDPKFAGGADGNLGKAIFQKLNMSIDYPQSKLFLFNWNQSVLQSARMDSGKTSAAIPFWNKNHILVFAKINDLEPTPFMFDTGASVPVLSLDYYLDHIDAKAQVPIPKEGQPKALPFTMKSLTVGGLTFNQVFSIALDLSFIFELGKMHYPGIIGASILQASVVHINFADSIMFFEKK